MSLRESFEKVYFEKSADNNRSMKNDTACKELNVCVFGLMMNAFIFEYPLLIIIIFQVKLGSVSSCLLLIVLKKLTDVLMLSSPLDGNSRSFNRGSRTQRNYLFSVQRSLP